MDDGIPTTRVVTANDSDGHVVALSFGGFYRAEGELGTKPRSVDCPVSTREITMKLLAMVLSVLLGSYSVALAQTGTGAAGGSPGTDAGQSGASNGTTGTNSGEGSTTGMQGTTGAGGGPQGNPTNSIHDNSVKKETSNPGLQKGPVK
jgi:hypothetical protein